MPLDFPSGPTVGQQYLNWTWNGVAWVVTPGPPLASLAQMGQNAGRNYLDNALFRVQQRGAGPFTAGGYTLDRYYNGIVLDTNSVSAIQLTDAQRAQIGDEAATYGLQNTFTGNSGATAFSQLYQRIEGVRRLSGKSVTVSFWAASGAPLSLGVSIYQIFGTGGSPSTTVTIAPQAVAITPTFARYQATFVIPSAAGKVFGTNGDDFSQINIFYSSGANQSGNSGIGVQSGTVTLWGMQVEIGTQATPLEKLDPQRDLARCQRFFQNLSSFMVAGNNGSGNPVFGYQTLLTTMRAAPTATIVGTVNYLNASAFSVNFGSNSEIRFGILITTTGYGYGIANLNLSADL